VTLHYKGTLDDGTEFDSSYSRGTPMTVEVGAGQLIEGFDSALGGMSEGETKTVTITAADAYGERDPDANAELEKEMFPKEFEFSEGMNIPLTGPLGQSFLAQVTEIKDTTIVADLNHPMAGKDLTFEIEVVNIGETEE